MNGVDELGGAVHADVQVLVGSAGGCSGAGLGRSALGLVVPEVDDLDGLPAGENTRFTWWACSPWLSISRIPCSRYRHPATELEGNFEFARQSNREGAAYLRAPGPDRPRSETPWRRPGRGSGCPARGARRAARRPVERHEGELSDRLPGPEHDRDAGEVGDLEREVAAEARVDEAGRRVDDQPEPAERALALDPARPGRPASRPARPSCRARTRRGGSRTTGPRRSRTCSVTPCGGSARSIAGRRWLWKTRNEGPSLRSTLAGWTIAGSQGSITIAALVDETADRSVREDRADMPRILAGPPDGATSAATMRWTHADTGPTRDHHRPRHRARHLRAQAPA